MKKVLSVLLAVCLFATMLVPAFAAVINPDYGKLADVAKVEFDKTEYALGDVVTDDGYLDVPAMLTCWDSNGNRTNYDKNGETNTEIRAYWSSNNEVLALDQDSGKLTRIKNNTNADIRITIRVTLASGKQASTVIVVPANSSDTSDAYGYRVANAKVEKGMTFNAVNANNAKVTYKVTAPGVAGTLYFLDGKSVVVAAADTAAAIADKMVLAGNYNYKGITYVPSVPAVKDGTISYTTTEEVVDPLTPDQLAVNFKTTVVGTAAAGTAGAGSFTAGTKLTAQAGTKTAVINDNASAPVDWTSATTVNLTNLTTITVDGIAATFTAGTATTDPTAFITTIETAINTAAAAKNTANAALTTTYTAYTSYVLTGNADGTIDFVRDTQPMTYVAGTITAGSTVEYAVTDAKGATTLTVGGKTINLTGTERAYEIAQKILAAKTGFKFAEGADTTAMKNYTVKEISGVNVIPVSVTFATTETATATTVGLDMVYNRTTTSMSFGDGATVGGTNPLVYNIGDEITPILSNYSFTGAQKDAFKFAVRAYDKASNSHYTYIPVEGIDLNTDGTQKYLDIYGLKFLVSTDKDGKPCLKVAEGTDFDKYIGTYVYVRVLNDKFANAQTEKEFNIKLVDASSASKKILPAEAQLGVNQTLDLRTLAKSVADVKSYWTVEPYGDYQSQKESGLIAKVIMETVDSGSNAYGWTVKGLAPGVVTVKLYDSYKDMVNGKAADSMKLNIGAGSPAVPTPSTATATVKVNEQVKLSVKNLNADEYVKWSVDNANTSLANFDGASATVYGKKEGTAVVTAKVYESKKAATDGKDPIYTFKTTVTVKAAESKPVTTPSTPVTGPTSNPQTGDSIFANLIF